MDAPHQVPPPYPPPAPPPQPAGYPPYGYYGAMPVRPGPAPGLVYAGFWIRFVAYLIDAAILNLPLYGLLFALFGSQLIHGSCGHYSQIYGSGYFCTGSFTGLFFLGVLAVQLVHAIYFTLMWSFTGSTVGQKLFRLTVVDASNGGRISVGKAAVRFLGYIVSGLVFNMGYMWAGWDPQKQGWHDKIASTFVVQRA